MNLHKPVLQLNASYEPLNVCSVRRAHVLVYKGKAEVVESWEQPLRTSTATYPRPHVIRLVTYVRVPRTATRKISRRALFAVPIEHPRAEAGDALEHEGGAQ